jgi:outer membrane autotransporter protein
VSLGGTIGGTGTVNFLNMAVGGTVAPGNSIGTMHVTDAFFGAGSTYQVELNAAGQSDQILAANTATIFGGTVQVLAGTGSYAPSTTYTILTAPAGVTGTFAAVTSNLAFLDPTLTYDLTNVFLTLTRNATLFADAAATPNQLAVADALDVFPTDNGLFLAVANQTAEGARQAFDALSGEIHATIPGLLADDSRYLREAILGRLVQASYTNKASQVASLGMGGPQVASLDAQAMALGYDDKSLAPPPSVAGLAFWTRAYGAWGDFDGNLNAASTSRDLGGFLSGLDARIGGTWRLGLGAGYSQSDISVSDRHSAADVESFHLAGYAGGMAGPVALRGGGAWTWNDIDSSRAVIFPGFFEREKASYDADTGQLFGEAAYPVAMGRAALEPFAGIALVSIDTDSFKEHGGNLAALNSRGGDQDVGYSTLGLRAGATIHWGSAIVTPHVSAAWQHAFDDITPSAAVAFASTGISFDITGVPLAEDTALIEAGLDFNLSATATLGASYSGQFGDGVEDNAVKGRFNWLF